MSKSMIINEINTLKRIKDAINLNISTQVLSTGLTISKSPEIINALQFNSVYGKSFISLTEVNEKYELIFGSEINGAYYLIKEYIKDGYVEKTTLMNCLERHLGVINKGYVREYDYDDFKWLDVKKHLEPALQVLNPLSECMVFMIIMEVYHENEVVIDRGNHVKYFSSYTANKKVYDSVVQIFEDGVYYNVMIQKNGAKIIDENSIIRLEMVSPKHKSDVEKNLYECLSENEEYYSLIKQVLDYNFNKMCDMNYKKIIDISNEVQGLKEMCEDVILPYLKKYRVRALR